MSNITSIGYLGPPGSFSEEAARKATYTLGIITHKIQAILGTNRTVIEYLRDGKVSTIVMAVRNSTTGEMPSNTSFLNEIGAKPIGNLFTIPIIFCLMGLEKSFNPEVHSRVLGHSQAKGQCSDWLSSHSLSFEECESNSVAAQMASRNASACAMASESSAHMYGLHIYERGCQNVPKNVTTFGIYGM